MVRKIAIIALLFFSTIAVAKKVPNTPTDRRWVQDYANKLSPEQEIFLLEKLKAYYDSTGTEIVIVTENSLEGDDIFDYSHRLAESWGIGQKGKDNGVLFYAAIQDRKMYIQVGYGAEGALPDIYAKRIIENILKPRFREEKYGLGFQEGTDRAIEYLEGEFVAEEGSPSEGIPLWVVIVIFIIIILIFSSGGNDGKTYRYDNPRPGAPPFWIGGGSRGGGGGWSGGGGGGFGGGFGGGSFGGGGAGGSW